MYIVNRQNSIRIINALGWGWGMIEHRSMVSIVIKTVVNTVIVYTDIIIF